MRGADQQRSERARSLRRASTDAEMAFWQRVRNRQLGGFKFTRQAPIGRYYVDFLCRERRIIVELDGGHHAENSADRRRDQYLNALGYRVVRFWNNEVMGNIEGVSQILLTELRKQAPHPSPLPACGEREGPA